MIPQDKTLLKKISEALIVYGIEAYDIAEDGPVIHIRTMPAPPHHLQVQLSLILKDYGLKLRAGELPENWNKPKEPLTEAEFEEVRELMRDGLVKGGLPRKYAEYAISTKPGGGMTKQEYMDFHKSCCDKMMAITKAKNSDYTGESGDPFANFAQIGMLVQAPSIVEIGFITRMSDKLSRIGSFVTKGTLQVKDESVEDTLLDLANYCLLFAGYLRSRKGAAK